MKAIVNEDIDFEIKRVLSNLNIEIGDHEEIPFEALEALKTYIGYKESACNIDTLLHIFAYNYILYAVQNEDKDLSYDITVPKLFENIESKKNYLNHLLVNYLRIIYYPNLEELVTDRLDLALELGGLLNNKGASVSFIGDIIANYLRELFFIYSNNPDCFAMLVHILKNDDDPFNTYKKYFNNKQNYLSYKGLIIKTLYLYAYSYLGNLKDCNQISKSNEALLNDIKRRIDNNDVYELPEDLEYCKLLLVAFYYPSNQEHNKKSSQERTLSLLLYTTYN